MAQKPSFLKKISVGLATASTAALIIGAGTSAMAAGGVIINRTMTGAAAADTNTGANFDQDAVPANAPVLDGSVITTNSANGGILTFNKAGGGTYAGLILGDANGNITATITTGTTLGFISNGGNANNVADFILGANQTFTITGAGLTAAQADGAQNAGGAAAKINVNANGNGQEIAVNDFTALGTITFNNNGSTLTFDLANAPRNALAQLGANAKVVAAGAAANGILNISNGFLQVADESFATVKTINIDDDAGLIFNTNAANNTVALQQGNNSTITFAGANSTLVLQNNVNAINFKVANGSLGSDGKGIIEFDTTANAGALISSNGNAGTAVIGKAADDRANQFIVTAGAAANIANIATITGGVFANNLTLGGGKSTFAGAVDATTTTFKAVSDTTLSANSTLGDVNFGNTASVINVADTFKLTGNFTGDTNGANTAGTISFNSSGTLTGTTTNVKAIEALGTNANGIVKLSGEHNAELRLGSAANSSFELADGTVIDGGVNLNNTFGNVATQAGSITLLGDAEITGDIGTVNKGNPPVVGVNKVGNITLANNKDKTLTLGGANIIGDAANNASINFQAKGGTLVLNSNANNVLVQYNLAVAKDNTGVVDASSLADGTKLAIDGKIGTVNAVPANNISLGRFNAGNAEAVLTGDAAINTLVLGDKGSVKLQGATYKIASTENSANNGTVIFNATTVVNGENPMTLLEGTNLGTSENPLANINFANDTTLTVKKNVGLYAGEIKNSAANQGSFVFDEAGTNVISAVIGADTANGKFNTVTLSNKAIVEFTNGGFFNGASTINPDSILKIGGNYTTDSIVGNNGVAGTLQFINEKDIEVKLANAAAGAKLTSLTVAGSGDVKIIAAANADVLKTSVISFVDNSAEATITLPTKMKLDGINIESTVSNVKGENITIPAVVVSADSIIAANQTIGDNKNFIMIALGSDNTLTVNQPDFYAGIVTTENDKGSVIFNADNSGVITLGDGSDKKLKAVTINGNTINLGDTFATKVTVADGKTYIAGNGMVPAVFDANLTLGTVDGNANAIFADKTKMLGTSNITTAKANTGSVTFKGGALVSNIGTSAAPVASVQFIGAKGSLATLQNDIYTQKLNFGNSNIAVANDEVILSGPASINGNINLGANKLIFANGASTWGTDTTITTSLENGTLGNIEIVKGATVKASADVITNITINDQEALNSPNEEYLLIGGGANLTLPAGSTVKKGDIANINSNRRFIGYNIIQKDDKNYYLMRTNEAVAEATANLAGAGIPNIGQNIQALFNVDNTGNAAKFADNMSYVKDIADSNKAIIAATEANTNVQNVVINTAATTLTAFKNRMDQVRYLGTPAGAPENILAAPEGGAVAAGDAEDNVSYGAWVKPFYNEATQKKKGGVAGYKAKTTGGIFGFDTMANDNLMIGAAIGITKSDIKHSDYKSGDKTEVNGFSFSLYGAQQLVDNFFVQGGAIFSANQVKNKFQRYIANTTNTANNDSLIKEIAKSSYDNMTFGGNVMVGYDAQVMEGVLFTPMAGLNYLKSSDESYKETGTTLTNRQFSSKLNDRTDVIVGGRVVGTTLNVSEFALYPEAHAFVTHKLNGKLSNVKSKLDGQTEWFNGQPDTTAKTSYNLGLSVSARPGPKMEYGIGYDANIASKYVAHQGTLKIRVNF